MRTAAHEEMSLALTGLVALAAPPAVAAASASDISSSAPPSSSARSRSRLPLEPVATWSSRMRGRALARARKAASSSSRKARCTSTTCWIDEGSRVRSVPIRSRRSAWQRRSVCLAVSPMTAMARSGVVRQLLSGCLAFRRRWSSSKRVCHEASGTREPRHTASQDSASAKRRCSTTRGAGPARSINAKLFAGSQATQASAPARVDGRCSSVSAPCPTIRQTVRELPHAHGSSAIAL
mmetsp:Transcript_1332/g.3228  ORF Transcript_1332/g.3228 Transcript_1332/m.3228 type:complete len:237 (+) Transcript_1332:218-928(+)